MSQKSNENCNFSKAVIIGSGFGGLATAIRLQLKGYKTTVFLTGGLFKILIFAASRFWGHFIWCDYFDKI